MESKKTSKLKETTKSNVSREKVVDLLDEDKPISGQKYVCLSFISPENHIKKRELFYF